MSDNKRRIALRVHPNIWEQWNNKRHSERTSFQKVGVRLFTEWFGAASAPRVEQNAKTVLTGHSFSPEFADSLSLEESRWLEGLVRLGLEHLRRAPGAVNEQGNPPAARGDIDDRLTETQREMGQAERSAGEEHEATEELRRSGEDDKPNRRGTRKRIK